VVRPVCVTTGLRGEFACKGEGGGFDVGNVGAEPTLREGGSFVKAGGGGKLSSSSKEGTEGVGCVIAAAGAAGVVGGPKLGVAAVNTLAALKSVKRGWGTHLYGPTWAVYMSMGVVGCRRELTEIEKRGTGLVFLSVGARWSPRTKERWWWLRMTGMGLGYRWLSL
jgi:hypothetical protein